MKMPKLTKTTIIILIGVILLTIAVAYAVITWSQTITWTIQNESFTVNQPSTLNYGVVVAGTVKTETYTVTNNGNTAITVAASTSGSGFTAAWDTTSATIAVGDSTTFALTLTINGAGSCTVSFNKA